MRYFIGKDGKQLGPFGAAQVREQLDAGLLSPTDLIWRDGMPAWAPVATEFPPETPPPLPSPGATATPPLANSAAGASATTSSAVVDDEGPILSSRGRRLAAASIDHLLVYIALAPALLRFFPGFVELVRQTAETGREPDPAVLERLLADSIAGAPLLLLLIIGVMQTTLLCLRGQTLGKLVCRIRIVRLSGERAGFVHAFVLRALVVGLVTGIPVLGVVIGVIDPLLIFREDHRCLHDLIAGTVVVDD